MTCIVVVGRGHRIALRSHELALGENLCVCVAVEEVGGAFGHGGHEIDASVLVHLRHGPVEPHVVVDIGALELLVFLRQSDPGAVEHLLGDAPAPDVVQTQVLEGELHAALGAQDRAELVLRPLGDGRIVGGGRDGTPCRRGRRTWFMASSTEYRRFQIQLDLRLGVHQQDIGVAQDELVVLGLERSQPVLIDVLFQHQTVVGGVLVRGALNLVGARVVVDHFRPFARAVHLVPVEMRVEDHAQMLRAVLHDGIGAARVAVFERFVGVVDRRFVDGLALVVEERAEEVPRRQAGRAGRGLPTDGAVWPCRPDRRDTGISSRSTALSSGEC